MKFYVHRTHTIPADIAPFRSAPKHGRDAFSRYENELDCHFFNALADVVTKHEKVG